MGELTLKNIFIYVLILVIFLNIFNWVDGDEPGIHYFVALAPLITSLVCVVVFDNSAFLVFSLLFVGATTLVFGDEYCDLSGFIFFGYAIVLSKSKNVLIGCLTFNYLAIGVKYMMLGGPVTRVLLDVVGFAFCYLVGYVIYRDLKNEQSR